ncbi:MAG: 1-acyl-sn-glycerol-3-phosphate acyltransferase [Clostridia bacterium]|nr:1-acyl-sn-glycerol-3-phosphate acyltransferase [Clostridia bacterium]
MNKFVMFCRKFVAITLKNLFPVRFYGDVEGVKVKKSIIVANHVDGWDGVIFIAHNNKDIRFMYKTEHRQSKFLQWALDGMDFIPVSRGDADMAATKATLRALKDDKPVWIFPEGTRNRSSEQFLPFKTGTALFAIKTQAPIRPIITFDTYKMFTKNHVMIGEEFELSEFYGQPVTKDVLEQATKKIYKKLMQLKLQLEEKMKELGVERRKPSKKRQAKIDAFLQSHKEQYELAKKTYADVNLDEE